MSTDSAWRADWLVASGDKHDVYDRLDRAFVQLNLQPVEIIVGKQIVPAGVGHLFSAVSQVPHHPFVVADAEYEKTEDAVAVTWTGPVVVEARFLPKVAGQKDHNYHVRVKGATGGYDVAVTAGRSDDKAYAGLETAGNLGDSVVRGEVVGYREGGRGWMQGLLGYDRVLSAKWSAQVELFYNGFGTRGDYALGPLLHRSAPYRGLWYAGTAVTWEVGPRAKATLGAIANALDPSALFHLSVAFSLGANLDLLVGQYLNAGKRDAEFGGVMPDPQAPIVKLGVPDMTYAVVKYAF